jgi:hypothetical protein
MPAESSRVHRQCPFKTRNILSGEAVKSRVYVGNVNKAGRRDYQCFPHSASYRRPQVRLTDSGLEKAISTVYGVELKLKFDSALENRQPGNQSITLTGRYRESD